MKRQLSSRERRLLALLILIAFAALCYLLAIEPIVEGYSVRAARRQQLETIYRHNQKTIASVPLLRRQAEQQRKITDRFTIRAATIEDGRELLKTRLRRAIEHAGGEYREGSDGDGRTNWAKVRAKARMTLPQLTSVLAQLQNQPPWLVIDTLAISADDALVTGKSTEMDIEIEASIPLRTAAAR